jgi:tetratricopeptide (TPR) repeat protein
MCAMNAKTNDISDENETRAEARQSQFVWWRWALGGFAALLLVAATGAFVGYQAGVKDRSDLATAQVVELLQAQFDLAITDKTEGRYELARQRLEYILEQDPAFPGVMDVLADVLMVLNATATPTLAPTVTNVPVTPTPDMRGAEELYQAAGGYLAAGDWTATIETLDVLRKNFPTYQAVQVDGMYYQAFRNRGVDKILKEGNLEGGTYDLGQAERFGLLDAEAKSFRDWARYYITGASFWEIDWGQAAYYFGLVAPVAPYLHDGTGWTASERFREAALRYTELLVEAKMWCEARDQLQALLAVNDDPQIRPTAQHLQKKCEPPTPKPPEPTETETPTPTPEPTATP